MSPFSGSYFWYFFLIFRKQEAMTTTKQLFLIIGIFIFIKDADSQSFFERLDQSICRTSCRLVTKAHREGCCTLYNICCPRESISNLQIQHIQQLWLSGVDNNNHIKDDLIASDIWNHVTRKLSSKTLSNPHNLTSEEDLRNLENNYQPLKNDFCEI